MQMGYLIIKIFTLKFQGYFKQILGARSCQKFLGMSVFYVNNKCLISNVFEIQKPSKDINDITSVMQCFHGCGVSRD